MAERRLAVVTGASSGIGAATAAALAADGWRVVLVARGRDGLDDVADRIAASGGVAEVESLDAADGDAALAMARRVLGTHGVPEAIVNSAGAGTWRFIEHTPPAEAAQMMGAPYGAAYNLTHAFMGAMLQRRRGVFVHVGSPASLGPWPGATAYTTARWALRGLHEALRQDLIGTGLHSCHVMFGEVSTPYFEVNAVGAAELPGVARWFPVITPEECAAVILDVIRRPRPQVVHPPRVRAAYAAYRVAPALLRPVLAWRGPRH